MITHYADLLKFMCKNLLGWDGVKDDNGRHILQYVGTDIIRNQEPNFWVDFVAKELRLFEDHWDYVIIPDTRFPNEIDRMKESGFDVMHIRVMRPESEDDVLTDEHKQHTSETALDDVSPDEFIINDGSIIDLHRTMYLFAVNHFDSGK